MLNAGTVQAFATLDDSGFKRGMRDVRRQGDKTTSDVERRFSGMGRHLAQVGAMAASALAASFVAISGMAIKQAAEFESLRISMDVLNGSAEEGARNFERLKEFSAGTPFQLKGLAEAQNMLQGFGMSADDAFESLTMIGDIAAITGADINGIGIAFGQAAAEGRLMTRDIRQLINQGVPAIKLLADTMGVAQSEVLNLASEGQISFEILQEAFRDATTEGGMFADGMKRQSRTLSGVFSTLKDNVSIFLGEYGKVLTESIDLKGIVGDLTGEFQDMTEAIQGSGEAADEAANFFAGLKVILSETTTAVQNTVGWISWLDNTLSALTISDEFKNALTFSDEIADIAEFIKQLGAAERATDDLGKTASGEGGLTDIDAKLNDITTSTKSVKTATEQATEAVRVYKQAVAAVDPSNTIFDPSFVGASIEPMQRLNDIVRNMADQDYTGRLSQDFGKMPDQLEQVSSSAMFFTTTFADGLENVLFQAQGVMEAIKGIAKQLASRALITGLGALFTGGTSIAGGFFNSMFGGVFHDGGIVPGVGERSITAKGGEMILTKSQQRALAMGGSSGGGTQKIMLVNRLDLDGREIFRNQQNYSYKISR